MTTGTADGTATPAAVPAWRGPASVALGALGLALYNWWLPVAVSGRLAISPDELFSDLEATGQPHASLLQQLDLVAGVALVAALVLRGPEGRGGRRPEWPWLVAFAASGAAGGRFAYACPEGLSASCRAAEWRLALPHHHYVHVLAGVAEFAFGTTAVYVAWRRTRHEDSAIGRTVRWTARVLAVSYPLLGLVYLTDRFGAFVEPVFFTCFSVMIVVELVGSDRRMPNHGDGPVPFARRILQRAGPRG